MSYQPTNWKTGDVITEQKLNKLENGIVDMTCDIMFIENSVGILTKTWQEIYDAMLAKKLCIIYQKENSHYIQYRLISQIGIDNEDPYGKYYIHYIFPGDNRHNFYSNTSDDYPGLPIM